MENDYGFKFNIGDDVAHSATVREATALNASKESKLSSFRPLRLTVIERLLQECHGGVQRFYQVRVVSTDSKYGLGVTMVGFNSSAMTDGTYRLTEPELVPYAEPDAAK